MKEVTFLWITFGWIALGLITFVVLLFIPAPYGRHTRDGWGVKIPNRAGWFFMETPSLLVLTLTFITGAWTTTPVTWIFFSLWAAHYINRSLIYPFQTRTRGKVMPLIIALFAVFFNFMNASLNGYYLTRFGDWYTIDWLTDPRFIIGIAIFLTGAVINISADHYLLNLRKTNGREYKIPQGRLFRRISCPNFFGEILEWTGFAIMVWNPAGLAFALWTFFNLVPRALDHHRWYRAKFENYPSSRKAVIPYLL